MTTNFTPGPWTRRDANDIYDDHGRMVVHMMRGSKATLSADPEKAQRRDADANLISAAPDLYDALAAIIEGGQSDLTKARAALAKARGDK